METIFCTKCRLEYPATNEYFYTEKRKRNGLTSSCKKCIDTRNLMYKDKNPDKIRENWVRHYEKHGDRVKQRAKTYYELNKDAIIKIVRKKYNSDPEFRRKHLLRTKRFNMRHPNKQRERKHLRRAQLHAPFSFTQEQWLDCLERFDRKCAYCGESKEMTQDHFIPVSKGGDYTVRNIVPACVSCNSSKNNRGFKTWFKKQEFYSKAREEKVLHYLNYHNDIQQAVLF